MGVSYRIFLIWVYFLDDSYSQVVNDFRIVIVTSL